MPQDKPGRRNLKKPDFRGEGWKALKRAQKNQQAEGKTTPKTTPKRKKKPKK
jgi:hypothetical protein